MARHDLSPSHDQERAVPDDTDYADDERRILLWRLEQFKELGFSFATAVVLASERVDLGLARRLIRDGCPAQTAAKILL